MILFGKISLIKKIGWGLTGPRLVKARDSQSRLLLTGFNQDLRIMCAFKGNYSYR